jgi:HK97 family phage portal protein
VNFIRRLRASFSNKAFREELDSYVQRFLAGKDLPSENGGVLSDESALKYSAVFGCCRVLAETFASTPLKLYRRLPNGDRQEVSGDITHLRLKYEPSPGMTGFSYSQARSYDINLHGNHFAFKMRNAGGQVIGFEPIDPENVAVKKEVGKVQYSVRDESSGIVKDYGPADIYHEVGLTRNGWYGMSPLTYYSDAASLGLAYETLGNNFYRKGMMSSGVFEHPGFLEDVSFSRLSKHLDSEYVGMRNGGKPMLLEDGLTYKPLTVNPIDAQLLESKKYQISEIARFYRVPLHLLQDLDRATNNNIEQQSLEFVMYTMLPIFKRAESALNSQILGFDKLRSGLYYEYNIAGLLRGDMKSMYDAFSIGRQWGWLSVNDIRRMLNMNRVDGGDVYLSPLNMEDISKTESQTAEEIENLVKKGRI